MKQLKLTLALLAGLAVASVTTAAFAGDDKETTIRVAKSRYGRESGVPGEITVVWDEAMTRFGKA